MRKDDWNSLTFANNGNNQPKKRVSERASERASAQLYDCLGKYCISRPLCEHFGWSFMTGRKKHFGAGLHFFRNAIPTFWWLYGNINQLVGVRRDWCSFLYAANLCISLATNISI